MVVLAMAVTLLEGIVQAGSGSHELDLGSSIAAAGGAIGVYLVANHLNVRGPPPPRPGGVANRHGRRRCRTPEGVSPLAVRFGCGRGGTETAAGGHGVAADCQGESRWK